MDIPFGQCGSSKMVMEAQQLDDEEMTTKQIDHGSNHECIEMKKCLDI
jgi:hypothetical protein